jgi:DNA-binding NarL/FixJ family response regulator
MARAIAKTWEGRTSRRLRKKVEMLFAHLKRILKLDRLRLRGPNGAHDELILAATAQNFRNWPNWSQCRDQELPERRKVRAAICRRLGRGRTASTQSVKSLLYRMFSARQYVFVILCLSAVPFVCGGYRVMGISVVVVDDHPLVVEAILGLLYRTRSDFEVAGIGASASDVVDLCVRNRPHLAIVDLNVPGDSYRAIASVTQISPSTKIVALSESSDVESAIRALDGGASGYVLKESPTNELTRAISTVLAGETYVAQCFASQEIAGSRDVMLRRKAAAGAVILSIREQQIVRLLMSGKTNKEIGRAINISEKTVKHYMTVLIQKLNVRNRLEVVIAAQKLNQTSAPANLHV